MLHMKEVSYKTRLIFLNHLFPGCSLASDVYAALSVCIFIVCLVNHLATDGSLSFIAML